MSICLRYKDLLEELTSVCSLSGYTSDVGKIVLREASNLGLKSGVDVLGSVSVFIAPAVTHINNSKIVMLSAHMDSCGYLVGGFGDNEGEVLLKHIGYPDVNGKQSGRVFCKDRVVDIVIKDDGIDNIPDLGWGDSDTIVAIVDNKALSYINVGDPVQFYSKLVNKPESRFVGSFMDNKAGVVALLCVMEKLSQVKNRKDNFCLVFTELEEVSEVGGRAMADKLKPQVHICVDIFLHDVKKEVGRKVVIPTGPMFNKKLVRLAIEIAEENKIPYEVKITRGSAMTDVDNVVGSCGGVACVEFDIPGYGLHGPKETISKKGLLNTIKLVSKFCEKLQQVSNFFPIEGVN